VAHRPKYVVLLALDHGLIFPGLSLIPAAQKGVYPRLVSFISEFLKKKEKAFQEVLY